MADWGPETKPEPWNDIHVIGFEAPGFNIINRYKHIWGHGIKGALVNNALRTTYIARVVKWSEIDSGRLNNIQCGRPSQEHRITYVMRVVK